jgi:hypothetical protein
VNVDDIGDAADHRITADQAEACSASKNEA